MPRQFSDGRHEVWHGDAVEALGLVADESCALIFADPPYNIGKDFKTTQDRWPSDQAYVEWCQSWLELCIRKLTPTGSLYLMSSTQSMPYLDLWLRERMTILSRIVWHYDSSGVQARKYFGSMWDPIIHSVMDPQNYVFNADDIKVSAKTGAQRKLIDYRKPVPAPYSSEKVPGTRGTSRESATACPSTKNIPHRSPRHCSNASSVQVATLTTRCWIPFGDIHYIRCGAAPRTPINRDRGRPNVRRHRFATAWTRQRARWQDARTRRQVNRETQRGRPTYSGR